MMRLMLASTLLGLTVAQNWTNITWDIIIVGAGPAGIIVADRMSEANLTTLLLEGGGSSYGITGGRERPAWLNGTELSRVDVPGLYKSIFASTNSDLLCGNATSEYGGCTLGGSSAINAGLFFEPPASDYDLYNPQPWKSKDMASATKRLYSRQPSTSKTSLDGQYYLQTGYEAARDWLVNRAGYRQVEINEVANDKDHVFGRPVFDYVDGQRGGPVTNYLQTALKRSNFMLQSGVRVTRIIRDGQNATGVLAVVNGTNVTIPLARTGRIILSGGAIQSPQILMFSGIGNLTTLDRLNKAGKLGNLTRSEWINNTAVGDRLFDNPNTFIELESPKISSYVYSYDKPPLKDAETYLQNRSGPYTFASETSVFWSFLNNTKGRMVGLQGTIDSSGFADYLSNNTITLNIYGTSGLGSTGRVLLNENFIPGASDDVYYSDPQDALDIAIYIRSIFDALNSTSLTPLNIPQNATIEQIRQYITTPSQYAVGKVNHWSSSCRLGSCVDTNAQVMGTNNIHVVDGSIVPPLTVNPQFGIMVAAERASELILGLSNLTISNNTKNNITRTTTRQSRRAHIVY